MPLSYTTSDLAFAQQAAQTLRAAGVRVYVTGEGSPNLFTWTAAPNQYTIRVLFSKDDAKASHLLLGLGAAQSELVALPSGGWVKWTLVAIGAGITMWLGALAFK